MLWVKLSLLPIYTTLFAWRNLWQKIFHPKENYVIRRSRLKLKRFANQKLGEKNIYIWKGQQYNIFYKVQLIFIFTTSNLIFKFKEIQANQQVKKFPLKWQVCHISFFFSFATGTIKELLKFSPKEMQVYKHILYISFCWLWRSQQAGLFTFLKSSSPSLN